MLPTSLFFWEEMRKPASSYPVNHHSAEAVLGGGGWSSHALLSAIFA